MPPSPGKLEDTVPFSPSPPLPVVDEAYAKTLGSIALLEERGQARLRFALRALVLVIVFEGALRKWVFPEGANLLYFLKDGMLGFVYVTAALTRRTEAATRISAAARFTAVAFVILAFFVGLSALSPTHPDDRVAMLGVRAYLFYPPLLLVVPKAYVRREDIRKDAFRLAWILVGLGALVLVQVVAPRGSIVNRYAWNLQKDADVATAGSIVRATGTFSYIWPFVDFIMFAGAIVTPMFFLARTTLERAAAAVGTLAAIVCAVGTGSRAAGALVAVTLLGATAIAKNQGLPGAKRIFQLAVGFAVAFSLSGPLQRSFEGLSSRTIGNKDAPSRVLFYALDYTPILGVSYAMTFDLPILGVGVGVGQHSASMFIKRPFLTSDLEGPTVVEELGIPGFLAYYAFRAGLIALVIGVARRSQRGVDRVVCGTAAVVLVVGFPRTCVTDSLNFILTCLLTSTMIAFSKARDASSERPVENVAGLGLMRSLPGPLTSP